MTSDERPGCPQERLSAFIDGELEDGERAEIDSHLEACASCRRIVEEILQVKQEAGESGALDDVTVRRFIQENRRRRVAAHEVAEASRRREPAWFGFTLAAAAALVIVIAGFVTLGGQLDGMFRSAVGSDEMGGHQASLSAGIY